MTTSPSPKKLDLKVRRVLKTNAPSNGATGKAMAAAQSATSIGGSTGSYTSRGGVRPAQR
jgi:hypothetical protein